MYDVDIPGGITMKESDVISPGSQVLVVDFRQSSFLFSLHTPNIPVAESDKGDMTDISAFGSIALAICFDIRFQYLIASIRESRPDICAYLLPAAFNMTTGPKAWQVLQRARAIDNQIYVGMCSPARHLGDEVSPGVRAWVLETGGGGMLSDRSSEAGLWN